MMTVDEVKAALDIQTDQELAEKAERGASAVSNWRKAGEVPASILVKLGLFRGEGRAPSSGQEISVYSLAGAGRPQEWTSFEPLTSIIVPTSYVRPTIRAIKVRGRSMEETIMEGACVGVDTADKEIISGNLFAVWLPYEGAVVKRLYVEPDRVRLKSDNPVFPEFSVPANRVEEGFVLGRVRWIIQEV